MPNRRADLPSPSGPGRRRRLALSVAAIVCAVGGGVAIAAAVIDDQPAPPQASSFAGTDPSTRTGASPQGDAAGSRPQADPPAGSAESTAPGGSTRSNPATDGPSSTRKPDDDHGTADPNRAATDSEPTKINIPAIGVDTDFVPLDLTSKGELDTPRNPDQVGWFTGARTPGGPGVAVVAGHVTWNGDESAFFNLSELKHRDRIKIKRQDGSTAIFSVRRLATFPKHSFPTDQVYRRSDHPELVLITCGGDYSASRHHYDANVIAWADLVTVHHPSDR